MTKQDYTLLAKVFAGWHSSGNSSEAEQMRSDLAKNTARALAWENPAFDRERFLKACEVTP